MAPFAETPITTLHDTSSVEVFKEPDLLDGWWTSKFLFALERRAIFSKTWICITHRSRFNKPGDYISFELAGFPILLILGKDKIARAFHNVCRHRAYTVTKRPAGSSLVLGCRYHGWSYDTKGKLVKAPQFDGIEGFDRSENSLFAIQTCTDRQGFVHINLDAGRKVHAPDLEDFLDFSGQHGISPDSKWLTGWELSGAFNWKTIGASDRTGIGTPTTSPSSPSSFSSILSVFYPPILSTTPYHTFVLSFPTVIFIFPASAHFATATALPVSPASTTIKIDIFTTGPATSLSPPAKQILESFFLAYLGRLETHYDAHKYIRYEHGEPKQLPLLKEHLRHERLKGREMYPGRPRVGNSEGFCRAEKVCNELDILAKERKAKGHGRVDSMQGELEW
ncbi:hypothetical protein N0V90_008205 [Kalmusia sp. IMI 367209]|nr:hypothetical protein N0V90_008205 [Kalmusia sp. IMI 367209]